MSTGTKTRASQDLLRQGHEHSHQLYASLPIILWQPTKHLNSSSFAYLVSPFLIHFQAFEPIVKIRPSVGKYLAKPRDHVVSPQSSRQ